MSDRAPVRYRLERGAVQSVAQYRFVERISSGGMGTVDLVWKAGGVFRRPFALKRLHPHLRGDPSIRSMFLEEARLAGMLRHPNIVPVVDVGEDDEGPFLVMELVDGVTVSALIRRHGHARETALPLHLAVHIARRMAEGLHAAHELLDHEGRALELVHRDVSPQNALVGYDGAIRLTDFGIAKAIGRAGERTQTGVVKGKLGYSSPEQLRFEPVDRRSDLFSLGIVLFELVSGSRLYSTKSDGPRRILAEDPPDLGSARDGVPSALVELAFELLAKDRADRPTSAQEVVERLTEIEEDLLLCGEDAASLQSLLAELFEEERGALRASLGARVPLRDPTRGEGEAVTPAAGDGRERQGTAPARSRPSALGLVAALALGALLVGLGAWVTRGAGNAVSSPEREGESLSAAASRADESAVTPPESPAADFTEEAESGGARVPSAPDPAAPDPEGSVIEGDAPRAVREPRSARVPRVSRREVAPRPSAGATPARAPSPSAEASAPGSDRLRPWGFLGPER